MIEYKLDDLGWEKFEQLTQSLLKTRLGLGIEAWGGHGDWGRDAYFDGKLEYPTNATLEGGFVFQCKFVDGANAAGAKPERAIVDAASKECSRIEINLSTPGRWLKQPVSYAFFTNAGLTPRVRALVAKRLTKVLPNSKISIHDGHDVCQWLRLSPNVARSFQLLNDVGAEIQKTSEAVKEVGEKVDSAVQNEIRSKLILAQALIRQQNQSDGVRELEAALALARAAKLVKEEVKALLALAMYSSRRKNANRRGYLDQVEKKIGEISAVSVRTLYCRVKAAAYRDDHDLPGAEDALKSALKFCESAEQDSEKKADTQAFAVRCELIVVLCQQDRPTEAAGLVAACDAHARSHTGDEDGELIQAAMSAGIFWSLKSGNEADAIKRIHALEAAVTTEHQAGRVGGQLSNMANDSSHLGFHAVALTAAEAGVRLEARSGRQKNLASGLYTVAVVTFQAGDHPTAKRKAEALLDACNDPRDADIKKAANHLLAEIARSAGDAETAIVLAARALDTASGSIEHVAFTKQAMARALSDSGRTEEALDHAVQAHDLMKASDAPAHALADVLLQVVSYASALGRPVEASAALKAVSLLDPTSRDGPEARSSIAEIQARAPKLAELNTTLRDRILEAAAGEWEAGDQQSAFSESLAEANAKLMRPLFAFWDSLPTNDPEAATVVYDYWGRGNFAQILRNAKSKQTSLNITLEVRSLDGVKQAIRLWGLYADLLLLIWKGSTRNVDGLVAFPEHNEMFYGAGGAGYMFGAPSEDEQRRKIWPCLTKASFLPLDVVSFLMRDARLLFASGRLVVVPAVGVGCVHPGHGPLEQLLTESAHAIAGLRSSRSSNEVPIGLLPYSPDAPFEVLANIIDAQADSLRRLRRLLVNRTRELAPHEAGIVANRELALEITDALHDLSAQQRVTARKHDLASAEEPLNGTFCQFHRDGRRLLEISASSPSPFAPLLTLQNFGYKWGVGTPASHPLGRYEPGDKSVIGPWLAPPTERPHLLALRESPQ